MNKKILNLLLILTSFIGYLEWGASNSMFLIQGEIDVINKLFVDPLSVAHPFTFLPLIGQLLLVISLFQKRPNRLLSFFGIGGIAVLLVFMFAIGIISENFKILGSTLPFIGLSIYAIRIWRKQSKENL